MRGNVPSTVIAGTSRTFDDVWALRNLNAPAGATVQFDNGEVISFAGVLTAWHAVLGPFRRVKVTAPGGAAPVNVLVDVAYDEHTAARMQPAAQALPLSSGGSLATLAEVQGRDSGNILRTPLVDTAGRLVVDEPDAVMVQSWDLVAGGLFASGNVIESGNRVELYNDGSFAERPALSRRSNQWIDLSAYRRAEVFWYARGITVSAGIPFGRIYANLGMTPDFLAANEASPFASAYALNNNLTPGGADVACRAVFGGNAYVTLNSGTHVTTVFPFMPRYVSAMYDAIGGNTTGAVQLLCAVVGYKR